MALIGTLYLFTSLTLAIAGLTMVGLATRAYVQTSRRAMIHLSIGFTLVVAGTLATTISVYNGVQNPQRLLFVNSGFNTLGYVFVIYSLVAYE